MPTPRRLQIKVIKDLVRDDAGPAGEPTMELLRAAFLPLSLYARIDIPLPPGSEPGHSNERLGLRLSGWPEAGNPASHFTASAGLAPVAPCAAARGRRRRLLVVVSCPDAPPGRYRLSLVRAGQTLSETRLARRAERVRVQTPARRDPAPPDPGRGVCCVLISGTAKSGTTWLEKIVNAHPDFLVLHEANTLRLLDGGAIARDLDAKRDVFRERYIPWLPAEFSSDDFAAFLRLRLAREVMRYFAAAWGACFVADRTPGYGEVYQHLYGFWPDARVLHVVRHPLDVITSWIFHEAAAARNSERPTKLPRPVLDGINAALDRGDAPEPGRYVPDEAIAQGALRFFAGTWRRDQLHLRRALDDNPDQFHVVRYEELSADFDRVVSGLFRFLDLALTPAELARIRQEASFRVLSGGRDPGITNQRSFFRKGVSGDWRHVLSPSQAAMVWPDVAEAAAAFGYAC